MLSPDSGIAAVTLQRSGTKGLDDVVVHFDSGDTHFIQVKHTRVEDSLTFGDLVTSSNSEASLLRQIAECWNAEATASKGQCEAYLVTNRNAGARVNTSKKNSRVRPPLDKLLATLATELTSISKLDDIQLPPEWLPAWKKEWLPQLDALQTDARKLEFLKVFHIQTSEQGLQELTADLVTRLAGSFAVPTDVARGLLARLDSALREWATSSRGKREAITVESVYEVLALRNERSVGEHGLPPPAPFFPTRRDVVDQLAQRILRRDAPIIFLSGEPGSGKTAIVSALANRRDPILDLRYHAFRPVTPDNQLLPSDASETAKSRSLWTDLLLQLRHLASGRLASLRVPVHTGMLSTDELRSAVLRIASLLGKKRQRSVVIAIDGIDHAARAGSAVESFLASLVAPDQVPSNVTFVIAGQPPEGYPAYPSWLRAPTSGVERIAIRGLDLADTTSLVCAQLPSAAPDHCVLVAREIFAQCGGHTLATVFAVQEAQRCGNDLDALAAILKNRKLSDGVEAYYEAIWNATATRAKLDESTMTRLAACLGLTPIHATGELVSTAMVDGARGGSSWGDTLRLLAPLVVENDAGFRVFHNDVRVFLLRRLRSNETIYRDCASRIADYFINIGNARAKHEVAQDLLGVARRYADQARIFTPTYVTEGYALGRGLDAITSQALVAADALVKAEPDWALVHGVECGARTLVQLRVSLQWRDADRAAEARPADLGTIPILPTERVVLPLGGWTADSLASALHDIERLLRAGEIERAIAAFRRWFGNLTPSDVLAPTDHKPRLTAEHEQGSSAVAKLLGRISVETGLLLPRSADTDESTQDAEAHYAAGLLAGAAAVRAPRRFIRVLVRVRRYYEADIQDLLDALAADRDWKRLVILLRFIAPTAKDCSVQLAVQAASLAALSGDLRLRTAWTAPLLASRQETLAAAAADRDARGHRGRLSSLTWLALLFGYEEPARDASAIREEVELAYRGQSRDERSDAVAAQVLFAAACLGQLVRQAAGQVPRSISPDILRLVLANMMGGGTPDRGFPPEGFASLAKAIVDGISDAARGVPVLETAVREAYLSEIRAKRFLGAFLESGWRPLMAHGDTSELRSYGQDWIGAEGRAWSATVSDRYDIVPRVADMLDAIGDGADATVARDRLRWGAIGYGGHKEYALNVPLEWFSALVAAAPAEWERGLVLLSLSREASRTGDNRMASGVRTAVASAAATVGPVDLDRLVRAEGEWLVAEDEALTDAFLARARQAESDEIQLASLWAFCTGQLDWQRAEESETLARVRDALVDCATRHGLRHLATKLGAMAPAEFASQAEPQSKSSRDGDADLSKLDALSGLTAMQAATTPTGSDRSVRFDAVQHVLIRVLRDRTAETKEAIALAWDAFVGAEQRWAWWLDGRHRLLSLIFPLVDRDRQWDAVRVAVTGLEETVAEHRVGALAENLGCLSIAWATLQGDAALRVGLARVVSMHETWLTGAGRLTAPHESLNLAPARPGVGWGEIYVDLLIQLLHFDEQCVFEAALRGLFRLVKLSPKLLSHATSSIETGDPEVRRRFLLLSECLACVDFAGARTWLEGLLKDPQLDIALSGWVALRAGQRVAGDSTELWPEPDGDSFADSRILPVAPPLLARPSTTKGLFTTASRPSASYLSFLDAACDGGCDDIQALFAASERATPPRIERALRTRDRLCRDMVSRRDLEVEHLMGFLRAHERQGRFRDVPLTRMAQALVPAADPHVFLNTPAPLGVEADWPVDTELDKLLREPGATELQLSKVASAALPDTRRLLAGSVRAYSQTNDAAVFVNHLVPLADHVNQHQPSVLNGRLFLGYDFADAIVGGFRADQEWLTYTVGGLFSFADGITDFFPSPIWRETFGWAPKPDNPLVWTREGREVAWFERRRGPFRRISAGDFVYRQPVLARWTCETAEWERLSKLLRRPPIRATRIDLGSLPEN